MTRRKLFTGVVVMGLVIAACGDTDTAVTTETPPSTAAPTTTIPPTTTTTVPPTTTTTLSEEELAAIQYEEDVKAIKTLFRRYSDSWFAGLEAGTAYLAEYNYPAEGCTAEDFASLIETASEGYRQESVVDAATVERDEGWAIPGGVAIGTVPEGRIYIMSVSTTVSEPGFLPSEETDEVHATVLDDGTTYFFRSCGKE